MFDNSEANKCVKESPAVGVEEGRCGMDGWMGGGEGWRSSVLEKVVTMVVVGEGSGRVEERKSECFFWPNCKVLNRRWQQRMGFSFD